MSVVYTDSLDGIGPEDLHGFFEGWPSPPSPADHLRLLHGSAHVWLARDAADGPVVGFVTATSDGVLTAFVPLLEVLPSHRGRGIGSELVRRMLATLCDVYAVDFVCDPDLVPFYERFGLTRLTAMSRRKR